VNYCSNTFDPIGTWIGEQLHIGRTYSYSAGCCYCCGADSGCSREMCDVKKNGRMVESVLVGFKKIYCQGDAIG
jgi:hypothetical protein